MQDKIIQRNIELYRLISEQQRKAKALLVDVKSDIIKILANEDLTAIRRRRLESLIKQIDERVKSGFDMIETNVVDVQNELVPHVMELSVKDAGFVRLVSDAALNRIVTDALIMGSPAKKWWEKQAESTAFAFTAQVRQGIIEGESIGQINGRIFPLLRQTEAQVFGLVHTSVLTVANDTRLAVFNANRDDLKALRQLSTLDGHTSEICMAYSGAEWNLDYEPVNGNKLPFNGGPPRHFRCRSVLIPITKIDFGNRTTRASDEGQIRSDITFDQFLDGKSKEYQDDLLGKGKADLWRAGTITLRDLLDQSGRPLTLTQLKQLN